MSWWQKVKSGVRWVWLSPFGSVIREALVVMLDMFIQQYVLKQVLGAAKGRARTLETEFSGSGRGAEKALKLDEFIVGLLAQAGVAAIPKLVHTVRQLAVLALDAPGSAKPSP